MQTNKQDIETEVVRSYSTMALVYKLNGLNHYKNPVPLCSGVINFIESMSAARAHCFSVPTSPGDGHSFPMRSMNESQNPLLANEETWEDNDDDNRGKKAHKEFFSPPSRPSTNKVHVNTTSAVSWEDSV